jgi:hypothetical protein
MQQQEEVNSWASVRPGAVHEATLSGRFLAGCCSVDPAPDATSCVGSKVSMRYQPPA